jgi:hypothetical protein
MLVPRSFVPLSAELRPDTPTALFFALKSLDPRPRMATASTSAPEQYVAPPMTVEEEGAYLVPSCLDFASTRYRFCHLLSYNERRAGPPPRSQKAPCIRGRREGQRTRHLQRT